MSSQELYKKLQENVRTNNCSNKGCLSNGKDNLQIVWFGNQYEQKVLTCSSCYVMNDEALKKSIPTDQNVLPVSAFLTKFVTQLKAYEENKSSNKWEPTSLKGRQKQHLSEVDNFEFKLVGTLKQLVLAVQGFAKKVVIANSSIFNNQIFNQIISMNTNGKMDGLLEKLQLLIKYLNISEDEKYRFEDLDYREKKLNKLVNQINGVCQKINKTLQSLLKDIQQKNSNISKI